MEQTELKKGTSIDWLMTQLYKKGFIKEIDGNEPIILMNQAKEMEEQQKGYSEEEVDRILRNFRTDFLPIGQVNDLVFNEWFEQFKKK